MMSVSLSRFVLYGRVGEIPVPGSLLLHWRSVCVYLLQCPKRVQFFLQLAGRARTHHCRGMLLRSRMDW